jgi:hypothetical protein
MGNVAQGTRKGRTLGKRRRAKPERNTGIGNRDLMGWLRLGIEDIRLDLRENHRARDREAHSRIFRQDSKKRYGRVGPHRNEKKRQYTE